MLRTVFIISCLLANGEHYEPKGIYLTASYCSKWVKTFEVNRLPSQNGKSPLCWCYKVQRKYEAKPAVELPKSETLK